MKRYHLDQIKPLELQKIIFGLRKSNRSKTDEQIMKDIQSVTIEHYRHMYKDAALDLIHTPTSDPAFQYLHDEEVFFRKLGNALTRVQVNGGMIRDAFVFRSSIGVNARNDIINSYSLPHFGDLRGLGTVVVDMSRLEKNIYDEVVEFLKLYNCYYEVTVVEFSLIATI